MRRTLGSTLALTLATALLLGGCGTDPEALGDGTATDPVATSTPSPGTPSEPSEPSEPTSTQTDGDAEEAVDYDVVALPSETAAGGTTSPMLTPVSTPAELDSFLSQFRLDSFADQIRTAATTSSYDGDLWAGVVSLGCDVAPGVFVEEGEAGYLVTPEKVVDPLQECFAPVTTVALVAIR